MVSLSSFFDSSIVERRDEILSKNSEYVELENKILEIEKRLKETLSPEALKIFSEYERLSVEQQTLGECLCLKNNLKI